MKERDQKDTPPIIDEINAHFKNVPEDLQGFSVERVAEKLGINKKILYGWVRTDSEFSESLERLKSSQEESSFGAGIDTDSYVDAMMIGLLLLETKDRHFKPENQ